MLVVFSQNHGSSKTDAVKEVKSGYGRYLLRYGMAEVATPELAAEAEKRQEERKIALAAEQAKMKEVAAGLAAIVLEFAEKANAEGHLFGSVTEAHVAEQLSAKSKMEIAKDQVKMDSHIKHVGEHEVKVQLTDGVHAKVTVVVTSQEA